MQKIFCIPAGGIIKKDYNSSRDAGWMELLNITSAARIKNYPFIYGLSS